MKVLFASRNFFPKGAVGGAQTSIKFLASSFTSLGHEAAVLSVDDHQHFGMHEATGIEERRVKLRNLEIKEHQNPARKVMWHLTDRFSGAMKATYREVLSEYRPDVVFSHVLAGLTTSVWDAATDLNIPVVHMVHDYYLLCLNSGMRRKGENCASPCTACRFGAAGPSRHRSQQVASVIYVSDHVRKMHEAAGLFSRSSPHIIHGSYEPARQPVPRTGTLSAEHLTLGYFGRFAPDKGVVEMIRALRDLGDVQWRLLIGGKGDEAYTARIKAEAAGLPIEFLGVQKPDEFYAKVDAVIVPSLWNDPAPRVVYEAGLHQVVPIVAERGGLPQLVTYGGRGKVFDADDPESLRRHIRQLASDRGEITRIREEWGRTGDEFSQASVSNRVLGVLHEAVTGRS